jgi:hypothetical protein
MRSQPELCDALRGHGRDSRWPAARHAADGYHVHGTAFMDGLAAEGIVPGGSGGGVPSELEDWTGMVRLDRESVATPSRHAVQLKPIDTPRAPPRSAVMHVCCGAFGAVPAGNRPSNPRTAPRATGPACSERIPRFRNRAHTRVRRDLPDDRPLGLRRGARLVYASGRLRRPRPAVRAVDRARPRSPPSTSEEPVSCFVHGVTWIGVAGWDYPDWLGTVYLPRPARGFDRLAWVHGSWTPSRISSTFYRPVAPKTAASWVRRVASHPGFRSRPRATVRGRTNTDLAADRRNV